MDLNPPPVFKKNVSFVTKASESTKGKRFFCLFVCGGRGKLSLSLSFSPPGMRKCLECLDGDRDCVCVCVCVCVVFFSSLFSICCDVFCVVLHR